MKMPKALKDDWVATLRSGEVKQGKYRLITWADDGSVDMCCLGVLEYCAFGHDAKKVPLHEATPSHDFIAEHGIDFGAKYNTVPTFLVGGGQQTAVFLNDCLGKSFADIADLVEQQIEGF